jgi:hypothetical protein
MDALKMAQMHQIYRQMQVLSANEVRARLNLLPREGGDEYENPATSSSSSMPQSQESQGSGDSESDESESPPERSATATEARVLFNLTHVARQKSKNRKAFMEWFYGGFRQHREEWKALAAPGDSDPQFFASASQRFSDMIDTVTDDALVSSVEQITTTMEKEMFRGT